LIFDRRRVREGEAKAELEVPRDKPGRARENGRDELAFPAPVGESFILREDLAGTCHRFPQGGSFLPASNDQETRR